MSKATEPSYVKLEYSAGDDPPIVHCPICGNPTIVMGAEGGSVTPCVHLVFIYVGMISEFQYMSQSFEERTSTVNSDDLDWDSFPEFLKASGYGSNLLALEVTHGGPACGPVWYTDVFGFDFGAANEINES